MSFVSLGSKRFRRSWQIVFLFAHNAIRRIWIEAKSPLSARPTHKEVENGVCLFHQFKIAGSPAFVEPRL